uniref:Uncharacterized protein n=1 Tax=Rhizophora mucronata TaxID=61149 RepID=A0A2P2QXQ5_RHIMU
MYKQGWLLDLSITFRHAHVKFR